MLRKLNREKGSVTIEATIALSTFMFAIVTILSIVNICIVQARVSNAINMTAKELSQYSYIYALTGLVETQANMNANGQAAADKVDGVLEDINSVYNEIEGLAKSGKTSDLSVESVKSQWSGIKAAYENGQSIASGIEDIAKDPKSIIFGIAQLAGSEAMDIAKSKVIAEPLSRALCKKHLVPQKDGDVEAYLKLLGVVPDGTGSYYDALDFSESSLFPKGSNQIIVNVVYDVKIIALLPIDFSFTFNQTAITHGWLAGEDSYRSNTIVKDNKTAWTDLTATERASVIRHEEIDSHMEEGYFKTKGLTDVPLYNPETNEFVMISSMNPLYSGDGALDDINDKVVKEAIEMLCTKVTSSTNNLDEVTVQNGNKKETHNCSGASKKVILVIPEDEGLKEKMQAIIDSAEKNGVEIELKTGYGNGAKTTTTTGSQGEE